MKRFITSSFSLGLLLAGASTGWAVQFDQDVVHGVHYGSGNANGSWTTDTANNIELGLRTHQRIPAENTFNSAGNGVYNWIDDTVSGKAKWNYDFSIDVNASGAGSAVLSDYTYQLSIDYDPSAGHTWSVFNPLDIPDNHIAGGGSQAQNSENPTFAIVGLPGYDRTIPGTYDFLLTALDKTTGEVKAQTLMRVNVNGGTAQGPFTVPDAGSTVLLLSAGMTGLAAARRRFLS